MSKATAKFWDGIAEKYARHKVANPEAYQKKLDLTQNYYSKKSRLLEFGCGTGTTALYHAPHVRSILAVDISENMLKIARQKQKAAGITNVQFENLDIDRDTLQDEAFDMVMAHSILHLVDDLPFVLDRVHQLTKKGGIFVSSTVTIHPVIGLVLRPLIVVMALLGKAPRKIRAMTRDQLVTMIKEAGFEIIPQEVAVGGDAAFIIARKKSG